MTENRGSGRTRGALQVARERTVGALRLHYAQDHLSLGELERRLDAVYAAGSPAELQAQLSGLPELPEGRGSLIRADAEQPAPVKQRGLIVNVLGGSQRRGWWVVPQRLTIVTLAGGALVDLREASFSSREVEITVVSMFGGAVEILVPPDLRAEMTGSPVMGSFVQQAESASPEPDAPLIRVKGVALAGRVEVKVLSPGESYEPEW